jgi:hypothetical protein
MSLGWLTKFVRKRWATIYPSSGPSVSTASGATEFLGPSDTIYIDSKPIFYGENIIYISPDSSPDISPPHQVRNSYLGWTTAMLMPVLTVCS